MPEDAGTYDHLTNSVYTLTILRAAATLRPSGSCWKPEDKQKKPAFCRTRGLIFGGRPETLHFDNALNRCATRGRMGIC